MRAGGKPDSKRNGKHKCTSLAGFTADVTGMKPDKKRMETLLSTRM
jgi:hypothetical protein